MDPSLKNPEFALSIEDHVSLLGSDIDSTFRKIWMFPVEIKTYGILDSMLKQLDDSLDISLQRKIEYRSQHAMFWFGIGSLLLGVISLVWPTFMSMLLSINFPSDKQSYELVETFVRISSVFVINIGAYYMYASIIHNSSFYAITVPIRLFTFTVLMLLIISGLVPAGFLGLAVWEGIGALWLAHALHEDMNDPCYYEDMIGRYKQSIRYPE
mmetsp:Transcript_19254/g.23430  ORF Transcript_19254/g.23430 Transcript_19254/m.23430 type:complete len:212 (-) Transcript_19254:996-1631(-)